MPNWNVYVVEYLEGAKVNEYKYEVNYMSESIVPFTVMEKKQEDISLKKRPIGRLICLFFVELISGKTIYCGKNGEHK